MKMVLQARDLWEVVSGEEVKPEAEKLATGLGEEGKEGLGNHCAGPVCSGEGTHHRLHYPEGRMGYSGEVV